MNLSLPSEYELELHMVIEGQLPRKSNSRKIVSRGRGGPPMVIKSAAAREYMDYVALLAKQQDIQNELGSLDNQLLLVANVYYTSRRPDLSVELLLDALEKAGVVKNDRYVREQIIGARVDKERPRTELWLFSINKEREPITVYGGRKDETVVVY